MWHADPDVRSGLKLKSLRVEELQALQRTYGLRRRRSRKTPIKMYVPLNMKTAPPDLILHLADLSVGPLKLLLRLVGCYAVRSNTAGRT